MTLAADPGSLQGAVAAGILGCGPVVLGTTDVCARLLDEAGALVAAGGEPAAVADDLARAIHDAGDRAPGFGHPVHRPLDPRAERILELADERGVSGQHVLMARELRDAVARVWGRPLTMNVSLPIAAVLLDLGFPASTAKAIPLLARTAGLLAHLAEEREHPVGFLMAGKAEEAVDLRVARGGRFRPVTLSEAEALPWDEQRALDDESYRAQIAYLFDRSPFYREKLAAAGFDRPRAAGGLDEIGALPLTDKHELRATRAPGNPFGAHLCADPADIVRIHSTSGTTGTPSYIPLTAADLDNWVTGIVAELRGVRPRCGRQHRLDLRCRPVRRGRRRSPLSSGSGSATSRSAPGTPSG